MSGMWSMGLVVVAKQKKRVIKILLPLSPQRRYYYQMHGLLISLRDL